jgi:hypothetical protein
MTFGLAGSRAFALSVFDGFGRVPLIGGAVWIAEQRRAWGSWSDRGRVAKYPTGCSNRHLLGQVAVR